MGARRVRGRQRPKLGLDLVVFVFDPTELGAQPFGKQRAASIAAPGTDGEKYTPTSGIWQTVWVERVPETWIERLEVDANLSRFLDRCR